ncbi:MAG: acylphosphatase [Candidatus Marinimicrobia bacterium]|nr:acylphosphatase [Candidatus Neomarinimicrobiota bacterium]MCH8068542.1 acylphosphatase [Candidatus Neomarinimicrobiota bacterium]
MSENATAHIVLKGRVQMVGFRWFAYQWAGDYDLSGWVKNNIDRTVEIEVEGKKSRIESFIKEMKIGPRFALVDNVDIKWSPFLNEYRSFEIHH